MSSKYFPLLIIGHWSEDERKFILDAPFVYIDDEKGLFITIPAGFDTDYNSVPQVFESWFPATQFLKAGLVHDFLYRSPTGLYGANGTILRFDRTMCDDIHSRILQIMGCRWTKRQAIRLALRIGGWVPWKRYREGEKVANSPSISIHENGKNEQRVGDEVI